MRADALDPDLDLYAQPANDRLIARMPACAGVSIKGQRI